MSERLSLMKALKTGRLADFIAQEEARGVESVTSRGAARLAE